MAALGAGLANRLRGPQAAVLALVVLAAALTAVLVSRGGAEQPERGYVAYRDAGLPVPERVADLMARMSMADKLGQMVQVDRRFLGSEADIASYRIGSLLSGGGSAPADPTAAGWADMVDSFQRAALSTPLGIPIIYGVDAVHGHNNVVGATIFPHNIGLGATRDPGLVERIGRATAVEVAATGISWNFAPCVCVARNDRWGRTYESYGELPEIPTMMTSIVTGLQGQTLGAEPTSVMATAKHFIADGGTTGGDDQGNAEISEAELRQIHLPPFQAAIERGVGAVMISFSSWNGEKVHGHKGLITGLLKTELGFGGIVISDWAGIDQIDGEGGLSEDEIVTAVDAGIDMVMLPDEYATFLPTLRSAVEAGRLPLSRIDDANRRILTKKFELGLFERPYADRTLLPQVGGEAHRTLAREAVRKSLVLLKNRNNLLPLDKAGRLFVAGRAADDIGLQSGGWTKSWQGQPGNITPGTTILAGIQQAVGSAATVTYSADGAGINRTYRAAIAVVAEPPYAEFEGDRPGSLALGPEDQALLDRLSASGVPLVVVLVSGRPLEIATEFAAWDALIAAWLPGTEGDGVADVLFGDHAPTGKLPVTWMRQANEQPINHGDGKPALFPYGFGLTYPATGG